MQPAPPLLPLSLPSSGPQIAVAEAKFACALRADTRHAECWGDSAFAASPDVAYAQVSAGRLHTCALRANNGRAECWGSNSAGQSTPPPGVAFTQISAGGDHTCGIRADTALAECWGRNVEGQSAPLLPLPPSLSPSSPPPR